MPRGSRFSIFGQDSPEKLDLLFAKLLLVLFREIDSLPGERRHDGIAREIFLIHPGKLRKDLKVAPIALAECLRGPVAALRAHPLVKFDVPRPARQKIVVIQLEGALHDFGFIFGREIRHRAKRGGKPGLVKFSAGVFFELHSQRGHDIERGMHARKFLDHADHAPVILERVKARPRKHVTPGGGIAILRLVHVPQDHQVNAIHREAAPHFRSGRLRFENQANKHSSLPRICGRARMAPLNDAPN